MCASKVLLVTNFYSSLLPSGENQVFAAEKKMLIENGHAVEEWTRHSDSIRNKGWLGFIEGALATPWNPWSSRAIKGKVAISESAIVHVHNTFPLISPSIFHAIGNNAARVLTLHNYRLFCAAAIPQRKGLTCTKCLDSRSSVPGLIHGCYRNSRAATLPLAISVGLHRVLGTWTDQVDAFITMSEFQRELMIKAGLPSEKVHVKPNFYPGNPQVIDWSEREPYIVYAGRLTAEKGVVTLIRAWQAWGRGAPELRLVGDGELRSELESMATGLPVRFLGRLDQVDAIKQIAGARLQILPSECFETFGLVVIEAFAHGTPSAVADIGALPSIVENGINGVVFAPANPQSLLHSVRTAWESPGLLERLGLAARIEFESKYTEAANYAALMEIYKQAIWVSRNGKDT